MEQKPLPNRKQITVAIMKESRVDRAVEDIKSLLSDMDEENQKQLNVLVGSVYKSITDSSFYLGKSVSRALNSENVTTLEDLERAVEKLKSVMELTQSYMDGIKAILNPSKTDSTFDDIVSGLDMGEDE